MKRTLFPLFILTLLFSLCSCDPNRKWPVNFPSGIFPSEVINLGSVNSEYDDFNSAGPPTFSFSIPLLFSSNRASEGGKFDILDYELFTSFNQNDGSFSILGQQYAYPYNILTSIINTEANEYGPFIAYLGGDEYFLMFSSDRFQNMEIYVSYFNNATFTGLSPVSPNPFRFTGLNSSKYDGYATMNGHQPEIIFCSNRDGNLDLFKVAFTDSDQWYTRAKTDTVYQASPLDHLNSPEDDVCPYINGNLMVFTSSRSGGYGGYDLYYALWNGTDWQEPVNFGAGINTEFDEYRPITMYANFFENNLMVFSSNRPGGKGGFDLYYVGFDQMIK